MDRRCEYFLSFNTPSVRRWNKIRRYELTRCFRYIGAEDGIYEFHVNLHGRKVFPEITVR